jgi:glutaredoxin-related protein
LFNRAKLEYTIRSCDTPDKKRKLLEEYSEATSFPFVVIDGEIVGGLVDTAKYLVQKGLVSSQKS